MKNKSLLIVGCYNIVNSNSAGEKRIKLYAKSLLNKRIESVYLFHKNIIYKINSKTVICQRTNSLLHYIRINKNIKAVLVYPSTNILIELYFLILIRLFTNIPVFIELNEVRKYSVTIESKIIDLFTSPLNYFRNKTKFGLSVIQEVTLPFYQGLITISDNLTQYYKKKNENILQIPILSEIPDTTSLPIKYNNKVPFKITFTGTINIKKENLDLLFESIYNTGNKNIELHLYGQADIKNKALLYQLIKKFNLINQIKYHGLVDNDLLMNVFKESHLLILPRGYTKQNYYGFSTKLAEYLVSGRPVLVTNVGENSKYIFDKVNGFIIEPDSTQLMSEKLKFIIENYNSFSETIAKNALKTAKENFDYKLFSARLYNFLFNDK